MGRRVTFQRCSELATEIRESDPAASEGVHEVKKSFQVKAWSGQGLSNYCCRQQYWSDLL